MRKLIVLVFALYALPGQAQEIAIQKGQDTLYSTAVDSVYKINFTLRDVQLQETQKVDIKINSGTARNGTDFILLDAYHNKINQISISAVRNKAGTFEIMVSGNISESRTVNLQVIINDKGVPYVDIARFLILPMSKKDSSGAVRKPAKAKDSVDSLVFVKYNANRIQVYTDDTTRLFIKRKVRKEINVLESVIGQQDDLIFNFKITSTENEVFSASLIIKKDYEFCDDDKLYLDGDSTRAFIHAKSIFRMRLQKVTAPSTEDNTEIKLPLKKS